MTSSSLLMKKFNNKSDKSSLESPGSDVSSTHENNFSGSESELDTEMITNKTNENGDEQKLYQSNVNKLSKPFLIFPSQKVACVMFPTVP